MARTRSIWFLFDTNRYHMEWVQLFQRGICVQLGTHHLRYLYPYRKYLKGMRNSTQVNNSNQPDNLKWQRSRHQRNTFLPCMECIHLQIWDPRTVSKYQLGIFIKWHLLTLTGLSVDSNTREGTQWVKSKQENHKSFQLDKQDINYFLH